MLIGLFNVSNHTKHVSLSNQKCTITTLDNSHSHGLPSYSFAINFDRCVGSCSTLKDLSNRVCIPSKTEDLNLNVFNMIKGLNENVIVNLIAKNVVQIKSRITISVGVSVKILKNIMFAKLIVFGILLRAVMKIVNM